MKASAFGRRWSLQQLETSRSNARTTAAHAVSNNVSTPDIKLIVTDVDGTLLDSTQSLQPRVEAAVKAAAAAGVPLAVATGKARGPWIKDVFPKINMSMPGVFLQGLLICDADGKVLWEKHMSHEVILECLRVADQHGVTITAYAGDRILAAQLDEQTERLKFYREPTVEAVGHLSKLVDMVPMQKLIFMAPQHKIDELRPVVETALAGKASLTTALTGMLEVLPLGCSKGSGVAWLLDYLGVSPENVMAMGDGENDVEMLQLAGLGVAMGNAHEGSRTRQVADVIVATNDDNGVAEAVERFVLKPRGLSIDQADKSAAVMA